MTALGLVELAAQVGVPFACLVLMWIDHRDEKKARRKERKELLAAIENAIEEQTTAFRSLRGEIRYALTDGGESTEAPETE